MQQSSLQPSLFDQVWVDEYEQQEDARQAQEQENRRKAREQRALDNLQESSRQSKAVELLGILTGMSKVQVEETLQQAGGILDLARMPEPAVAKLRHVGEKRARQIKAMTDWAKLISEPDTKERVQISSPVDAANLLLLEMSLLEREQLRVIGLDTKNNVVFIDTVYSGSLNTTVVRFAEVLRMAVIMNAAGVILVHNHPSGDVSPSDEDVRVTALIRESARALDIEVMDHLIIGRNRYASLKEKGLYVIRDIFNETLNEFTIFHVFKDKSDFQHKID